MRVTKIWPILSGYKIHSWRSLICDIQRQINVTDCNNNKLAVIQAQSKHMLPPNFSFAREAIDSIYNIYLEYCDNNFNIIRGQTGSSFEKWFKISKTSHNSLHSFFYNKHKVCILQIHLLLIYESFVYANIISKYVYRC
jgi:hypothetical protein